MDSILFELDKLSNNKILKLSEYEKENNIILNDENIATFNSELSNTPNKFINSIDNKINIVVINYHKKNTKLNITNYLINGVTKLMLINNGNKINNLSKTIYHLGFY